MTTKELITAEIEQSGESNQQAAPLSLMEKLQRIQIDAPEDFAENFDNPANEQADIIWDDMVSGDAQRHNDALRTLFQSPDAVQAIVMQRSAEAAARYYATPEGEAELADWRALDGEPFHDDGEDGDDL